MYHNKEKDKSHALLDMMAHTSFSGCGDQKDCGSSPAWTNKLAKPHLNQ
jgi:hypothetical protein